MSVAVNISRKHSKCLKIIVLRRTYVCSEFCCTLRYTVRLRVYVIYDAIIYSKRPLLRLRPLPSNNELSAVKAHSASNEPHSCVHTDALCIRAVRSSSEHELTIGFNIRRFITTRERDVVMRSVAFVCVRLSVMFGL